MTLQWLLGWWNLIFIVPFAIALTYLGVYISTGITFGDADADSDVDADLDADHDVEIDADVNHDIDADVDHDLVHDTDHDADAHEDGGRLGAASLALLHLVGLGKVPLSLLVMMFLFAWGISGFAATQWLRPFISSGEKIAFYAMPLAAWMAFCVTALGARLFARVFPMNEAPATALNDLVGQRGVAVLPIDENFGLARIENPKGAAIQVPCRVAPGDAPIAGHASVVVTHFNRQARTFYVEGVTP